MDYDILEKEVTNLLRQFWREKQEEDKEEKLNDNPRYFKHFRRRYRATIFTISNEQQERIFWMSCYTISLKEAIRQSYKDSYPKGLTHMDMAKVATIHANNALIEYQLSNHKFTQNEGDTE